MAEKIYIRNASGELEPLAEERFETEDLLQELIGQHPELLAGEQMRPDDPLRWILVRREMPIEGWAVDHLLIDQHAHPTLVEVKRGLNRQVRREIVGQMLDYTATAAGVWSERDLRQVFEETHEEPDEVIGELLKSYDEPDVDTFWEQVATNLEANRLRLLFVADEIPTELERVVRFLNEQTRDNLEVLAVEVKQYPGQSGDALVSRVIGEIRQERQHPSDVLGRKETILEQCSPSARQALLSLTDAAQDAGARVRWARMGVSISMRCSLWKNRVFVARFRWWSENDNLPLELFVHRHEYRPFPPELRTVLQKWIDKFNSDVFVVEHTKSPRHDQGWAMTEDKFIKHADLITERLLETLNEIDGL